jgi:hypothetical protein
MCWCDPNKRTPNCGGLSCHPPAFQGSSDDVKAAAAPVGDSVVAKVYPLTTQDEAWLERALTYHAPKGDQPNRYERLRYEARQFTRELLAMTPPGREQSLARTKLEEVVFWANAAIARGE